MSYAPAFAPIAQECLDDLKACNEEPIGTGPYMMDGPWQHDEAITVTQWDDYAGDHHRQRRQGDVPDVHQPDRGLP